MNVLNEFRRFLTRLRIARRMHFNILKTLFFNFKVFNIKNAIQLPVWIYGKIQFEGIARGCVIIHNVKSGSVRIGGGEYGEVFGYSSRLKSYLRIKGKLLLGNNIVILEGLTLSVNKGAVIKIGDDVLINRNATIHAKESITIDKKCRVGWNVQILDTNFHYMINDGHIAYRNAPIHIEHNVWLANGVNVMKGTLLPAYSVVASGSLVNKDYSQFGQHCLFAGTPAKLVKKGVERILISDGRIDALFNDHKEVLEWDEIKERASVFDNSRK